VRRDRCASRVDARQVESSSGCGGASPHDEECSDRDEELRRATHVRRTAAAPRAMSWFVGGGL
jgi:hypothetical protein